MQHTPASTQLPLNFLPDDSEIWNSLLEDTKQEVIHQLARLLLHGIDVKHVTPHEDRKVRGETR
jgi:hypothetical protein